MINPHLNLSVDWREKGVPYAPSSDSESTNYGFIDLKGNPSRCSSIPEAKDEPALLEALEKINDWKTHYYSVGCEKCYNENPDGSARPIGFIEVCFNSIALAKSIDNYFSLFMRLYARMKCDYDLPVGYEWMIDPAHFGKIEQKGFTAAIYVTTLRRIPRKEALKAWRASVAYLISFLCIDAPQSTAPYFYEPA